MMKIYTFLINKLLGPWTGLGDDIDAVTRYERLDAASEQDAKQLIRQEILPSFRRLGRREQELTKLSLAYYLIRDSGLLGELFDSILPPFDLGPEPRRFFVWLWEVLFDSEPVQLDETQQYSVDNRVDVTYLQPEVYDK